MLKKTMTKAEFNIWAQGAEQLRKDTLKKYENAKKYGLECLLEKYQRELNQL